VRPCSSHPCSSHSYRLVLINWCFLLIQRFVMSFHSTNVDTGAQQCPDHDNSPLRGLYPPKVFDLVLIHQNEVYSFQPRVMISRAAWRKMCQLRDQEFFTLIRGSYNRCDDVSHMAEQVVVCDPLHFMYLYCSLYIYIQLQYQVVIKLSVIVRGQLGTLTLPLCCRTLMSYRTLCCLCYPKGFACGSISR
jgi:hypothetical protein